MSMTQHGMAYVIMLCCKTRQGPPITLCLTTQITPKSPAWLVIVDLDWLMPGLRLGCTRAQPPF